MSNTYLCVGYVQLYVVMCMQVPRSHLHAEHAVHATCVCECVYKMTRCVIGVVD